MSAKCLWTRSKRSNVRKLKRAGCGIWNKVRIVGLGFSWYYRKSYTSRATPNQHGNKTASYSQILRLLQRWINRYVAEWENIHYTGQLLANHLRAELRKGSDVIDLLPSGRRPGAPMRNLAINKKGNKIQMKDITACVLDVLCEYTCTMQNWKGRAT